MTVIVPLSYMAVCKKTDCSYLQRDNTLTVNAIPVQQQAGGEDLDCFPLLLLTMLHWGKI